MPILTKPYLNLLTRPKRVGPIRMPRLSRTNQGAASQGAFSRGVKFEHNTAAIQGIKTVPIVQHKVWFLLPAHDLGLPL
jgi:hypothetical protein